MALSNTAVPKYYGRFRDAVIRGEIPVCKQVSMEMNRIDALIASPKYYYDDKAVEGWIKFCENELVLTDGSDLNEYIKLDRDKSTFKSHRDFSSEKEISFKHF